MEQTNWIGLGDILKIHGLLQTLLSIICMRFFEDYVRNFDYVSKVFQLSGLWMEGQLFGQIVVDYAKDIFLSFNLVGRLVVLLLD